MAVTDIYSINKDLGQAQTPEYMANASRVGFEYRDNRPEFKPKRSIFGSILNGLSALALPASFIPGVGLPVAAGLFGAGILGRHSQSKANAYNEANMVSVPLAYPGLTGALASDPGLEVVSDKRDYALASSIAGMKGK